MTIYKIYGNIGYSEKYAWSHAGIDSGMYDEVEVKLPKGAKEVEKLAKEWGKSYDELMEQLEEID